MKATIIGIDDAAEIIGIPKSTFKDLVCKAHRGSTENRWLADISLCVLGEKRNTYYVLKEALIDHLKIKED